MNEKLPTPYQSPTEIGKAAATVSTKLGGRTLRLAWTAVALSLVIPFVLIGLVAPNLVPVHYDSVFVPLLSLFVPVPLALIGGLLAIVACFQRRTKWAVVVIVLAMISVPISLAGTWLLAMTALAGHPV